MEEQNQEQKMVEECADIVLKAREIESDEKLMKQVKPVIEAKMMAAKKFLDFEDLRKLTAKKAEEELEEQQRREEDYFSQKTLGWNNDGEDKAGPNKGPAGKPS